MGLGTNRTHVLGRNQRFFAIPETNPGTFVKPTTTNAVKVIQTNMKHEIASAPIDDNSDYRYHTESIQDKSKNTWSFDAYLIPSGVAGTEPDLSPLFNAVFGANNAGAGGEWVWSVANTQNWPTLSLVRHFNDVWMEAMWGCVIQKVSFKLQGGSAHMVHFEGVAMGYELTGPSTLNGGMAATDQMIIQTAHKNIMGINSVVKVDADDNSGAGYLITADSNRPTFTIESSITADDTDPVTPFAPDPTFTGSPISGVFGDIQIDAADAKPIVSAEIALENNHDVFEDEVFSQDFTDFAPDKVKVTTTIGFRMREDRLFHLGNPREFAKRDFFLQAGSQSGKRYKFDVDYGEALFPDITIPKDKSGTASMTFEGYGSGANGPLIVTHD